MKLEIRWRRAYEEHLKAIGLHPAEDVDAAVQRFAATGRGDVERTATGEYRLRVGRYVVWFIVEEPGVMYLLGVYGPSPNCAAPVVGGTGVVAPAPPSPVEGAASEVVAPPESLPIAHEPDGEMSTYIDHGAILPEPATEHDPVAPLALTGHSGNKR